MSRKIVDQFTHLKLSRQRKHQLRRRLAGLCLVGGCNEQSLPFKSMCRKHLKKARETMRKRLGCKRRFKKCASYQ